MLVQCDQKSTIAQSNVSAQILKTLDDIVLKRNYTVIFSDQNIALVASNNYHESDTISLHTIGT